METGQQSVQKIDPATLHDAPVAANDAASANDNAVAISMQPVQPMVMSTAATLPASANDNPLQRTVVSDPLHTQTQSTLAPTSEFMRYFLAALPSRYVLRGLFKTIYGTEQEGASLRGRLTKALHTPGAFIEKALHGKEPGAELRNINANKSNLEAGSYGASLALGSMALTYSYSRVVKRDIRSIFSETVADELGKPVSDVTDSDIRHSGNRIVQRTFKNYDRKMWSRYATDLMFLPAAWMRMEGLVDGALGIKGVQLFMDTWKRKTTMFEDLITFVNNKINPRNGLGQAISVGEIFDLYQHYEQEYNPNKAFNNVLEHGTGEGVRWAQSQPIFTRLTELMNLTYAYKHSSVIDPETGRAVNQADFALPKFIYLLGHDLIDVDNPKQTLATIEIANRYGIPAVKEMQVMLKAGNGIEAVQARFPVVAHTPQALPLDTGKKTNAVIAKGSTVQLDAAELPAATHVALDGMEHSMMQNVQGNAIA